MQSATISEDQVQELARAAEDFGLLDGELDFGVPGDESVSTTELSITIDGTTQVGYSGSPVIELDGTSAGTGVTGLTISVREPRSARSACPRRSAVDGRLPFDF